MNGVPDLLSYTPARCPVEWCGSKELEWSLSTYSFTPVVDGRLRQNEVHPVLMLACEYCGETLALVEDVALAQEICAHIDGQHVATAGDLRVDIVFST